jgi:nicotinate-nucleotide pyrophosphorylase (carboxylating)
VQSTVSEAIISDEVHLALQEDIGEGDLTAALIPASAQTEATVISRESAVICGRQWFDEIFRQLDENITIDWHIEDGDQVEPNQILCVVYGPARPILSGERTALNFLQTLSATATTTRRYVDQVKGSGVAILDTRKTIPGMRLAQKYAVTCGGGKNHRKGLYDGILIKENHIAAAGSIGEAVIQARHHAPRDLRIEVEVETLDEVEEALAAGADILLLDNMQQERLREAVRVTNGHAKLEASGGITLENIAEIAKTGVDYISIGALTKNIHAIDLSMRFKDKLPQ